MKIISSVVIFCFLAVLTIAFYPAENATNSTDKDSPAYEIAKHKFFDQYKVYKNNLEKGIKTPAPVDPSGNFIIDENGNFTMKDGESTMTNFHQPNGQPDLLSAYVFTQSTQTYTSINTTGTLVAGSTNCDDGTFGTFPIGFSFTYDGTAFTTFGVCCNGFLGLGATPGGGYAPMTTNTNNIVPFAYDLQGAATGSIYYTTTGSAPNRICTVEWYQWGFWPTTGNELSFQIKMFETTNAVQILYTTGSHTSTNSVEVGMNGSALTNFVNRTTTTNWASTTAGAVNSATCSFSPTIFPAAGLTFQYAPLPPPPPAPTLTYPPNHAVGMPLIDTLQWTVSAGATNYRVQIAQDSLFTSILFDDSSSVTNQIIISGYPPLFTTWWRVRARNAGGGSAFTIPFTFKTKGAATAPLLVTPANNAVNQPIAFTSNWRKAVDQTSKPHINLHIGSGGNTPDNVQAIAFYWYELYTDTTTSAVIRDSTLTDTTRAISGLLNNQNYWWRVKAKNEVGWGPFSAYFKFTTVVAAPAPPSLIAPANNSVGIIPTPLMDWSSVATATSYRIQISTDSTFATTQLDSVNTVDSLLVPAGKLLNNTLYYWHVYATNAGGNSAYSGKFHFTTSLVGVIGNGVIPKVFKLYQAYPNPFNPSSTIKFDIPNNSDVKMVLYNTLGQEVATLINANYGAGSYSITWDAANFPSGVYFYKITAGNFTDIHKMVLIK